MKIFIIGPRERKADDKERGYLYFQTEMALCDCGHSPINPINYTPKYFTAWWTFMDIYKLDLAFIEISDAVLVLDECGIDEKTLDVKYDSVPIGSPLISRAEVELMYAKSLHKKIFKESDLKEWLKNVEL